MPDANNIADTLSGCNLLKDLYVPIFCSLLPLAIMAIVYFIRRPLQKRGERRQKIDDLIEAIVEDANVYFMSSSGQNGVMVNITTKLTKLSSIIGCELRKDNAVNVAYSEFRKIVANDDGIKSRTMNVVNLVLERIRAKADALKQTLKIEA